MSMARSSGLAVLTAMLSASGQQPFAADTTPSPDPAQLLQQLDRDKDGFVNKVEAEKLRPLSGVFDNSDTNKDGKLDVKELTKALGMTPPK